jgi:hypothetical protein
MTDSAEGRIFTAFDLPYFLTDKAGIKCSRARMLIQSIADHDSKTLGKAASLALSDMDAVSRLLESDEDDQRLLSEAVLSALAVGLELRDSNPEAAKAMLSQLQRERVNKRHDAKGGSRDKANRMREIWATGKYTSRDICAEQECAGLGMSFSTARKVLRNAPGPKST